MRAKVTTPQNSSRDTRECLTKLAEKINPELAECLERSREPVREPTCSDLRRCLIKLAEVLSPELAACLEACDEEQPCCGTQAEPPAEPKTTYEAVAKPACSDIRRCLIKLAEVLSPELAACLEACDEEQPCCDTRVEPPAILSACPISSLSVKPPIISSILSPAPVKQIQSAATPKPPSKSTLLPTKPIKSAAASRPPTKPVVKPTKPTKAVIERRQALSPVVSKPQNRLTAKPTKPLVKPPTEPAVFASKLDKPVKPSLIPRPQVKRAGVESSKPSARTPGSTPQALTGAPKIRPCLMQLVEKVDPELGGCLQGCVESP